MTKIVDLYIDTEFNGFGGELMSMALVENETTYFYEVKEMRKGSILDPWVKQHVAPILYKHPVGEMIFQQRLETFLNKYDAVRIIADWHEDIAHFCNMLTVGPGERIMTPKLYFEIKRNLSCVPSKDPHNALADAIGNYLSDMKNIERNKYSV